MPPRGFTNPSPKTDSAREAVKSFYCDLCSKGYARMNEYEAHLSSYDHSHKQRLKDMRQLTRDPLASEKARRAEARANAGSGLISIKIGGGGEATAAVGGSGGGARKGGFRKAGFKSAFVTAGGDGDGKGREEGEEREKGEEGGMGEGKVMEEGKKVEVPEDEEVESDTGDEGYEVYDPRCPTD